jgi:hypothetical protein
MERVEIKKVVREKGQGTIMMASSFASADLVN